MHGYVSALTGLLPLKKVDRYRRDGVVKTLVWDELNFLGCTYI